MRFDGTDYGGRVPPGPRPDRKKGLVLTKGIKMALADFYGKDWKKRTVKRGEAAFRIGQRFVEMAINGDDDQFKFAAPFIFDRVEGKAVQQNVNEETLYIVQIGPPSKNLTIEGDYKEDNEGNDLNERTEDKPPLQQLEA